MNANPNLLTQCTPHVAVGRFSSSVVTQFLGVVKGDARQKFKFSVVDITRSHDGASSGVAQAMQQAPTPELPCDTMDPAPLGVPQVPEERKVMESAPITEPTPSPVLQQDPEPVGAQQPETQPEVYDERSQDAKFEQQEAMGISPQLRRGYEHLTLRLCRQSPTTELSIPEDPEAKVEQKETFAPSSGSHQANT